MAKENPLPVDAEKAEKKGYGGSSAKDIKTVIEAIQAHKSKSSKLSADLGNDLKKYEDKGGNKKAAKVASVILSMDITNAYDFWYHLEAILDVHGFFDQLDMFAQERQNTLNADSAAAADKKASGKVQTASAEPGIH